MSAQVHNHPVDDSDHHPRAFGLEPGPVRPARPRWLLPGLAAGIVAGGLVLAGVVSLSTVLYFGLFGGMLLMHAGHGGHGGQGNHAGADTHKDHGGGTTPDAEDLSHRSHRSQPDGSGSDQTREDHPSTTANSNETPHSSTGGTRQASPPWRFRRSQCSKRSQACLP